MTPTAKFRALLMAVALVAGCGSDGDKDSTGPAGSAGSAGQRTTRGSRGDSQATQTELASVDLTALLTEVPEYQGQGRNLFDYGRPPAPPPPPPRPQPVRPAPPVPPSPQPTRPAPAFRVDLKFAGFVETEEPAQTVGVASTSSVVEGVVPKTETDSESESETQPAVEGDAFEEPAPDAAREARANARLSCAR